MSIIIIATSLLFVLVIYGTLKIAFWVIEHRGRKNSVNRVLIFLWDVVMFPLGICCFLPYIILSVT